MLENMKYEYIKDLYAGNRLLIEALPLLYYVKNIDSIEEAEAESVSSVVNDTLISYVQDFQAKINEIDYSISQVVVYILCTVSDEFILKKKWGKEKLWRTKTLLNYFYKDTRGGEKFFDYWDDFLKMPEKNIECLEFMFICLSLGFTGKYRFQPIFGGGSWNISSFNTLQTPNGWTIRR